MPLKFCDFKTVITVPVLREKICKGVAFSASKRFKNVASGRSVELLFENPSDSDIDVHIGVVEVVSLANADIDIYEDVDYVPGDQIDPRNLNRRYKNRKAKAKVYTVSTWNGGSTYTKQQYQVDKRSSQSAQSSR